MLNSVQTKTSGSDIISANDSTQTLTLHTTASNFNLLPKNNEIGDKPLKTATASRDYYICIKHPLPARRRPEQLMICKLRVGKGDKGETGRRVEGVGVGVGWGA